MRRAILGSMALVTALVLAACPPAEDREVDQAGVDELRQTFLQAFNAHDAQAVAQLFAADAVMVDASGAEARGRDQIQQMHQEFFAQLRPQLSLSPTQTEGNDRLAFDYGDYQTRVQPVAPAPGQPQQPGAQPQQPGAQPQRPGAQPQQPGAQPQQPGQPRQVQPGMADTMQGRYLVVLERENDRWLIRAVMNVADMMAAPGVMPQPTRPPVDTPPATPLDTPPQQPADTPPGVPPGDQPPGTR